jgi:hypothetical protein
MEQVSATLLPNSATGFETRLDKKTGNTRGSQARQPPHPKKSSLMIVRIVGVLRFRSHDFINPGKNLWGQLFRGTRGGKVLFELRDF